MRLFLVFMIAMAGAALALPRAASVALDVSALKGRQLSTGRLALKRAYDRIVPWWNARTTDGSWVIIQARVYRDGKPLGDWIKVATWSKHARGARDAGSGDVVLDQDTLKVKGGADAVELKAELQGDAHLSLLGATAFASGEDASDAVPAPGVDHHLAVPYRTQRKASPEIAPRCCGPTSLSMALDFRGVKLSIDEVAALAKDPPGAIKYGNWAYLAATAAEQGLGAEVRAMQGLADVVEETRAGNLVIMALSFGKGVLSNAPISSTAGHLVLACGFDKSGNIWVNDPAGHDEKDGLVLYSRGELARAWKRGIGIVLKPRRQ